MKKKASLKELGAGWSVYGQWIKTHPWYSVIMIPAILLVYWQHAVSPYYYVDSEIIINAPGHMYNWNEIGRFGLVLLKQLCGLARYNPFFEAILLMVTLYLCAGMTVALFHQITGNVGTVEAILFSLLYIVYPIYGEQFLFQFQACEVVMGMMLVTLAGWYFYSFLRTRNLFAFILSDGFLVVAFGVYQSMVNLAICYYVAIFLFMLLENKEMKPGKCVLLSCGHFAIALVLYELIRNLFPKSNYLTDQVFWGREGILAIARLLLSHMKQVLLGMNLFYTKSLLLMFLFGLVFLFFILRRKEHRSTWMVLALLGMIFSPFALNVAIGTPSAYRTMIMLPFTGAVLWLAYSRYFAQKKSTPLRVLLLATGIVMLILQTMPLMRLFYTRQVIGENDQATAHQLIHDIDQIADDESLPVVFLGSRKAKTNAACYTLEDAATYVCFSVFELGATEEGFYSGSTGRIIGYFNMLGADYTRATIVQCHDAYLNCADMPVWPKEGSILERDGVIVVKLSN